MSEQVTGLNDFPAWELEAFADGIPMSHIAAFLEAHPIARQAWQQQQQQAGQVAAALYRFDCPTPEELRAYQWNELSSAAGHALRTHLAHCPDCSEELALLQAFVGTVAQATAADRIVHDALTPSLVDRLQTMADQLRLVVAHLVTPLTPQASGAAFRADVTATAVDSGRDHSLLFETDNAAISLLIRWQAGRQLQLSGQIFTPAPTVEGECKLTTATTAPLSTIVNIDETGTFVFDGILPGTYQLEMVLPDQLIVIPPITLS